MSSLSESLDSGTGSAYRSTENPSARGHGPTINGTSQSSPPPLINPLFSCCSLSHWVNRNVFVIDDDTIVLLM